MPIRVLASVIQRDNRLLVFRRPLDKRHGGLWEFPGGKVREGESDLDAARRELREELGVEVTGVGAVDPKIKVRILSMRTWLLSEISRALRATRPQSCTENTMACIISRYSWSNGQLTKTFCS